MKIYWYPSISNLGVFDNKIAKFLCDGFNVLGKIEAELKIC
jgi:hypothetical protein